AHVGDARLAGVFHAVAVLVPEFVPADAGEPEVAEVRLSTTPQRHQDVRRVGRRLHPAGLDDLADAIRPPGECGEGVAARSVAHRSAHGTGTEVRSLDGPAGQTRLARVANAVAVDVIKLQPAD